MCKRYRGLSQTDWENLTVNQKNTYLSNHLKYPKHRLLSHLKIDSNKVKDDYNKYRRGELGNNYEIHGLTKSISKKIETDSDSDEEVESEQIKPEIINLIDLDINTECYFKKSDIFSNYLKEESILKPIKLEEDPILLSISLKEANLTIEKLTYEITQLKMRENSKIVQDENNKLTNLLSIKDIEIKNLKQRLIDISSLFNEVNVYCKIKFQNISTLLE